MTKQIQTIFDHLHDKKNIFFHLKCLEPNMENYYIIIKENYENEASITIYTYEGKELINILVNYNQKNTYSNKSYWVSECLIDGVRGLSKRVYSGYPIYHLNGCYITEGDRLDKVLTKINKSLITAKISPILYKLIKTEHQKAKLVLVKKSKFNCYILRDIFDDIDIKSKNTFTNNK